MPIKIKDGLPAIDILEEENIFVMRESYARRQDMRPLKIAILNLMPLKMKTEVQLLRLLANTSVQVEIDLIHTKTHKSKNTSIEHLNYFYKTFDDIKDKKYDGMIITGAPVETLPFSDVIYWNEIQEIMEWTRKYVTSTLYICWGAQAGLYHHYGIGKKPLKEKMSGVFVHKINNPKVPLVRGFDDNFMAPHSRYTEVTREEILEKDELEIVAESDEAGVYIVISKDKRRIFVTGHSEYDPLTLKEEYFRDIKKGMNPQIPKNYFPDNDPQKDPVVCWRSHAHLLFSNWLNYYVYQATPFDIEDIS